MDVMEKLVELLEKASYECDEGIRDLWDMREVAGGIADFLIANGVTVQGDKDINVPIKWISAKDRLPEKGTGKVLVVKQYRGKPYIDVGEVINGEACCYADEYAINPREHIFTHWMPLPQPPKGE